MKNCCDKNIEIKNTTATADALIFIILKKIKSDQRKIRIKLVLTSIMLSPV